MSERGGAGVGWLTGPAEDQQRYRLSRLVARGAEGEVWFGVRTDIPDEPVAVKVTHPRPRTDPETVRARVAGRISAYREAAHPALVRVHEAFVASVPHLPGDDGEPVRTVMVVMEWVGGQTLGDWRAESGRGDPLTLMTLLMPLAGALDALHGVTPPVAHGDVKPANVLTDGRSVRLVDFGASAPDDDDVPSLVGTPGYLAPELLAGGRPSPAADRYAFGVLCQEMLPTELSGRADVARALVAMTAAEPDARPASTTVWLSGLVAAVAAEPTRGAEPDAEPTSDRPRRPRPLVAASAVVLVAAIAAGAFALDAAPRTEPAEATADPSSTVEEESAPVMPDVEGLTLTEARRRLRRLDIGSIVVEQVESGRPEGTVLDQSPASGQDADGGVTLTVAVAPRAVPELVGKSLLEAKRILTDLGVTVEVRDQIEEGGRPGIVLTQEPAAGSPVPDVVTLTVSRRAVAVFVSDMQAVEGDDFQVGLQSVNGENLAHSVWYQLGGSDTATTGFDLGRKFLRLRGTVGLADTAPSSARVKLEIFGDGISLFAVESALGQAVPVDVSVDGVLRLRISAAVLSEHDRDEYVPAVFGDLRALGAEGRVPTPTESP